MKKHIKRALSVFTVCLLLLSMTLTLIGAATPEDAQAQTTSETQIPIIPLEPTEPPTETPLIPLEPPITPTDPPTIPLIPLEPSTPTTPTAIVTESFTDGIIGERYEQGIEITGAEPLKVEIASGNLPDGLVLTSEQPRITGTPTKAETTVFTLKITGEDGKTAEREFTLTIIEKPKPPTPKFSIRIDEPSGWYTRETSTEITIEDDNRTGFDTVEYKVGNGNYIDITSELEKDGYSYTADIEIADNVTVYVTVTDNDGKSHTRSRYIECFDREPPTVRTGISNEMLRIEAEDDLSGVDKIYVNGNRFTSLTNGTLDIAIADYADDYEQISVSAVDEAGNKSNTVLIKNPYYKAPTPQTAPTQPPETTTPTITTPTQPPETTTSPTSGGKGGTDDVVVEDAVPEDSVPDEENPFTPDGQATVVDNATDEDGKEFYTFTTPNENIFYLVIDNQKDSENVYFLNAVTEDDLVALAEQEQAGTQGTTDALPPTCICDEKCEPGAVNVDCPVCINDLTACTGTAPEVTEPTDPTEEVPTEEKGGTNIIFIIIALLAIGGAGYYFKIIKPKKDLENAEDVDEIVYGDEVNNPTVNEDTQAEEIPDEEKETRSVKTNPVYITENAEPQAEQTDNANVADDVEQAKATGETFEDEDDPNADYMNGEDFEDNPDNDYPDGAFDPSTERKI